jgi:hypothetical protein
MVTVQRSRHIQYMVHIIWEGEEGVPSPRKVPIIRLVICLTCTIVGCIMRHCARGKAWSDPPPGRRSGVGGEGRTCGPQSSQRCSPEAFERRHGRHTPTARTRGASGTITGSNQAGRAGS